MPQRSTKGRRNLAGLFVFLCGFLLSGANTVSAKAWRGIEPLHSTRADVERLLGPPFAKDLPDTWRYEFPGEQALISYSSGDCEEGLARGWRVPKDTVVNISIYTKPAKIEEVLTRGKEYEQVYGAHIPQITYVDSDEGISFVAQDGFVHKVSYGPSAKDDKRLACGEYKYAAPIPPGLKLKRFENYPLDSFGNIIFDDVKARLDNFAIQLTQMKADDPLWRGYIIIYAGRRSYLGEAKYKANCYKNYLVRVRGIDAGSLFVVDGGFREVVQTLLFIMRADYYPPVLSPTVSPKKAQVIKRRLRSCYELSPRSQ